MFLSIGMLKQKYFLTDIFILSAEKQPIKLSWRKIEWLRFFAENIRFRLGKHNKRQEVSCLSPKYLSDYFKTVNTLTLQIPGKKP